MLTKKIDIALDYLNRDQVIGFPTDTVYGLGADPSSDAAIRAVFAMKHRSINHPLPILLPGIDHIDRWIDLSRLRTARLEQLFFALADRFWPGPLTLVVKKNNHVSELLTANQDTIAIRIPNNPLTLDLLNQFGSAIIGTSANRSGSPSVTTATQVEQIFGDQLLVLDVTNHLDDCLGLESTIVSLIEIPTVIRNGAINPQELQHYL